MRLSGTIRAVALLEAAKGLLVLLAGIGAVSFIRHDAQWFAERLMDHLHINPSSAYLSIFAEFSAKLTDTRLGALAALAAGYAVLRWIEAYGLWRERRWAEWFAAASAGVYIPFEIYELFDGLGWLSLGAFMVNVVIVGLMITALLRGRSALGA